MKRLNPDKLHVVNTTGDTTVNVDLPRRYTLTHSDQSGDLFLIIARESPSRKYDRVETWGVMADYS
jgi:hypothetical protein